MKNFHRQEEFPPDITANVILNAAVCQGAAPPFSSIPKTFWLELLEKSVKAVAEALQLALALAKARFGAGWDRFQLYH
jgi:hypothetical protein